MIRQCARLLFFTLLLGMLGCAASYKPTQVCVHCTPQQLSTLLKYRGIGVIQTGEQVRLVLLDKNTFMLHSANIRPQAYQDLDLVTRFLYSYPKTVVHVTGYTDNIGDPAHNLALSRQQAETVAHYLWRSGVDARVIYADSEGSERPIVTNRSSVRRELNNRVEINFQFIPEQLL